MTGDLLGEPLGYPWVLIVQKLVRQRLEGMPVGMEGRFPILDSQIANQLVHNA